MVQSAVFFHSQSIKLYVWSAVSTRQIDSIGIYVMFRIILKLEKLTALKHFSSKSSLGPVQRLKGADLPPWLKWPGRTRCVDDTSVAFGTEILFWQKDKN